MKVFRMNDYDWMAGEDLESCVETYLADHNPDNLPRDEALDNPRELTDEQMNKHVFVEDEMQKRSFREQLARMVEADVSFPVFFASTEY